MNDQGQTNISTYGRLVTLNSNASKASVLHNFSLFETILCEVVAASIDDKLKNPFEFVEFVSKMVPHGGVGWRFDECPLPLQS